MFPPLRMNTLFPTGNPNTDTVESLYQRYNSLIPHDINPALLHHLDTSNRYAPPFTTDNEIPHGLNGANPQLNSKTVDSIKPLDLAKLNQNEEKIKNASDKNKNDLNFKQTKQEEDNSIRETRAAVYDFKSKHPGMKFDFSGPTIKVADPISGEVHDTGKPTGHLSDTDKINLQSNDRINEIGARANETRNTNTLNENNRQSGRMKILEYKQQNKDFKFFSPKGGNIVAIDPTDPSTTIDTGISSGSLSDQDKLDLGLSNSLSEIQARGNQTRITNSEKPINKTNTNNSATQQRVGYANKARQLSNSNPEYAKWIKMNGNEFSITPPSSGGMFTSSGPDTDTYHKINQAIYGSNVKDDTDKSNTIKTKNTPKTDTEKNTFSSSTTKLYLGKNGTKYNIPMDKVKDFLKDNPDAQEVK